MKDVAIVGAGLAGLNCALTLERAGLDVTLFEASDAPGGRIRTDAVDGFLLDRGFQVLLTAYPEAQRVLDYAALDLQPLKPGALVWQGGRFHRFADPFRDPLAGLRLVLDPIVTLGDKLRVAKLRRQTNQGAIEGIFQKPETTTQDYLKQFGFSEKIVASFFRPFFGGVFLENELVTSSRYFEFLFRMFSIGDVVVPAKGMEAIPRQMGERLRIGTLLLHRRVTTVYYRDGVFGLSADDNVHIAARSLVIATEEPEARRLLHSLGSPPTEVAPRLWNSTIAFYFAAERAPVSGPLVLLNGEGTKDGPVNNAVVMSEVATGYAPPGAHLISASVVGQAPSGEAEIVALGSEVRQHLKRWFGSQVDRWSPVGARPVRYALPRQLTASWEHPPQQEGRTGVYLCGDYLETASIQGSLASGRRAAEALMAELG